MKTEYPEFDELKPSNGWFHRWYRLKNSHKVRQGKINISKQIVIFANGDVTSPERAHIEYVISERANG